METHETRQAQNQKSSGKNMKKWWLDQEQRIWSKKQKGIFLGIQPDINWGINYAIIMANDDSGWQCLMSEH